MSSPLQQPHKQCVVLGVGLGTPSDRKVGEKYDVSRLERILKIVAELISRQDEAPTQRKPNSCALRKHKARTPPTTEGSKHQKLSQPRANHSGGDEERSVSFISSYGSWTVAFQRKARKQEVHHSPTTPDPKLFQTIWIPCQPWLFPNLTY